MKGIIVILLLTAVYAVRLPYHWKERTDPKQSLEVRIKPPAGFSRSAVKDWSFGWWLRGIPLKPGKPPVKLYNGEAKSRQDVHYAVVDIDVGNRDLQQCADAVIRLRAEYLYSRQFYDSINFFFTSGFPFEYNYWVLGYRVSVEGRSVAWVKPSEWDKNYDYPNFKSYLNMAFSYCGTLSLSKQMKSASISELAIGDVFIRGGSPGHAVIVMDVATNAEGRKVFLLGQSYMPAQEFHILVNPDNPALSPWYEADFAGQLVTPEWVFERGELKRF